MKKEFLFPYTIRKAKNNEQSKTRKKEIFEIESRNRKRDSRIGKRIIMNKKEQNNFNAKCSRMKKKLEDLHEDAISCEQPPIIWDSQTMWCWAYGVVDKRLNKSRKMDFDESETFESYSDEWIEKFTSPVSWEYPNRMLWISAEGYPEADTYFRHLYTNKHLAKYGYQFHEYLEQGHYGTSRTTWWYHVHPTKEHVESIIDNFIE
jgi:hypothetical protein